MKFDHNKYGFKIIDIFKGNGEAEPHGSLIFKLNNTERLDGDTLKITSYIPLEENIQLLQDLVKSCNILINKFDNIIDKKKAEE